MKLLNTPIYSYVDEILREEDIHDVERVPLATAGNSSFVVFAVLLTLVHGFNVYLFLGTDIWPVIPVILHLVIAVVTAMIAMLVFAFLFDWYKDSDPGYINFDIYLFVIAYIPLIKHLRTVYNNKEPRLLDPELKKLAISTFLISVLLSLSLIYFFTDIIVQVVNATINHFN